VAGKTAGKRQPNALRISLAGVQLKLSAFEIAGGESVANKMTDRSQLDEAIATALRAVR